MQDEVVNRDAVYAQLYFEMRRYRDYELTAATWWTALLVAILSGLLWISAASGAAQNILVPILRDFRVKTLMTVPLFLFGLGILHALHYTNLRYQVLRRFCDKELEPAYSVELKKALGNSCWKPLDTIVCTIAALVFCIIVMIWWPSWGWAVTIGVAWAMLALLYWWRHHCKKPT